MKSAPEVLAPAGDRAALEAAVRAGADAVYFGVQTWNARARATNFEIADLPATLTYLHEHGVKGYLALNTLVFDDELHGVEQVVRAAAAAGVDAVIVQDLGLATLVRAVAPTLPLHASTQMTCTDAASVELARSLGARRVVLARELSVQEIATIAAATDVELEVFVHGALCVAYSGQCLTSEAIGGRSANRGACAQACRLPYDVLVDGRPHDVGERAYLLSPQDLEASALVPDLLRAGVRSFKIEGRLKGPDYVAASTRLYREALAHATDSRSRKGALADLRRAALLAYSRGSGPGFLAGVDHQRLVEGRTCEHRGVPLGTCTGVVRQQGRQWLTLALMAPVARGDGIVVEGGRASAGELGGRVWAIRRGGSDVESAAAGQKVLVWLGPDTAIEAGVDPTGRSAYLSGAPAATRQLREELERAPHRAPVDVSFSGKLAVQPTVTAACDDGRRAVVQLDAVLEPAQTRPTDAEELRAQLGRLGGTPFVLRRLAIELPAHARVPLSALNRARRQLVQQLTAQAHNRAHVTTEASVSSVPQTPPGGVEPPPAGLFVLCRNPEQARAALQAGANGVYLDFLELTGTGACLRDLRNEGASFVGVAPPRIRKPGEEKIDNYLAGLQPDAVLVRGLGALRERELAVARGVRGLPLAIGDFSLNVTNRLSAAAVLARGLAGFTPSFDLDGEQLCAMLGPFARYAEVVVHHPMPLFHMEHCVFAALLSTGSDYRTCGRPCERHTLALRDRAGHEHPVEADVGCRNTVFHAAPQSAATLIPRLTAAGVQRLRLELVRESAYQVRELVQTYRMLVAGETTPQDAKRRLRTRGGYGIVSGSLRVVT